MNIHKDQAIPYQNLDHSHFRREHGGETKEDQLSSDENTIKLEIKRGSRPIRVFQPTGEKQSTKEKNGLITTADVYHSRRHEQEKGKTREGFPLRWPNYTEDDVEKWITLTGCVRPDSACEVCRVPECCPLFKILIGEWQT